MTKGSLVVVGTGISFPDQMTLGAKDAIEQADVVLFNVGSHPTTVEWLKEHSSHWVDMYEFYNEGEGRHLAYERMVNAICDEVRSGKSVCAAFYGHPGVFVGPGYQAMQVLNKEGYLAYMMPGVSAVDCMFADLEFDPAVSGCIMYEASDFLLREHEFDISVPMILWQVGVVGESRFTKEPIKEALQLLKDKLLTKYPLNTAVINYVAATLPGMKPQIRMGTLGEIENLGITQQTTLLIPPPGVAPVDHKQVDSLRELLRTAA